MSSDRGALAGALLVGVLAALVAGTKFWLYGLLLLVAAVLVAVLVARRPGRLARAAERAPVRLRRGVGLGVLSGAVAVALAAVVLVAPLYAYREYQGEKTRAENWVRDADHELDSRDFETARLYLERAVQTDPDVPGVQKVRDRMAALEQAR